MEMLCRANDKTKTHNTVNFIQMDMKRIGAFFKVHSFNLILCFGNTLVHLTDFSEIESFCREARRLLKEGGKFLLQILNYDHILDHNVKRLPLIENNHITFERYYEYDNIKNLIRFRTILTVKERDRRMENEILLYPVRKHELDEALRNSGFTDISFYGDFDKSELKTYSLPLVVTAS